MGYANRMESNEEQVAGERDEKKAAKSEGEPKGPKQDDTDSTFWDTDEHSDAPGPTGTG
jgi:hypothetical protein